MAGALGEPTPPGVLAGASVRHQTSLQQTCTEPAGRQTRQCLLHHRTRVEQPALAMKIPFAMKRLEWIASRPVATAGDSVPKAPLHRRAR